MYRYTPTHKSNSAYYFNDYTQLQSIFLLSVYYWKMPPGNASRTPRRELSLTDKVKLIRESEATKKSVCVLAEQFKCGKTQVSTYLTAFEENADKDRKILCLKSPLEELNVLAWEWFHKARATNIPVSGPLLQEKALEFGKELKITDFKASNGWLECFRKCHAISFSVISGESASVPENICDD